MRPLTPADINATIRDLQERVFRLERARNERPQPALASTAMATTMIRRSSDQTIGSSGSSGYPSSFTRINMNVTVRDDLQGADLANDRINISTAGLYLLVANVLWRPETTATGNRSAIIGVNGQIASASQIPGLGGGYTTTHTLSTVFVLNAGDQVVLDVLQNAGSPRDLEANGFAPYLSATLLRS